MQRQRLNQMFETARRTSDARMAEVTKRLQQGLGGGSLPGMGQAFRQDEDGGLPDLAQVLRQGLGHRDLPQMQSLLSRLPPGLPHAAVRRKRPAPGPVPPGRLLDLAYGNAAGERRYKLYLPNFQPRRDVPLIVMLHGGTQDADDFAAGTRMSELAERHGFLVAYPEQSRNANAMGYWNWFRPADQQRGSGEPSIIAGLTERVIREYGIDARRIYLAGFSAGGAMAAVMGSAYPDLYAAIGVHSGLPAGAAHDVPSAYAAMAKGTAEHRSAPLPLIVFHGEEDQTVNHVNADDLVRAALSNAGKSRPPLVTNERTSGGRPYTRRIYTGGDGPPEVEQWTIHASGHAWSGGSPHGTYTDPHGPDASSELVRFFAQHTLRSPR